MVLKAIMHIEKTVKWLANRHEEEEKTEQETMYVYHRMAKRRRK